MSAKKRKDSATINNNSDKNPIRAGNDDVGRTDYDDNDNVHIASGQLRIHHLLTLAYLLSKGARHSYIEMTTTELGSSIKKSQQSASRHLTDLERDGLVERGASTSGRSMSIRVTKRGLGAVQHVSAILQDSMNTADSDDLACVTLTGVLVSGMGEGAYYMALEGYTAQFHSKIGYVPFPGTLNVRLQRREHREIVRRLKSERTGRIIRSFSDGRRTFGWAKCFPAMLHVGDSAHVQLPSSQRPQASSSHESPDDGGVGGAGSGNGRAGDICTDACDGRAGAKADGRDNAILCEIIVLERTHHDDSIIELISKSCIRKEASLSDGSIVNITVLPDDY